MRKKRVSTFLPKMFGFKLGVYFKNYFFLFQKVLQCKKRGSLLRQAKGRALQLSVSSDEAILCCVGADSLVDIYRFFCLFNYFIIF